MTDIEAHIGALIDKTAASTLKQVLTILEVCESLEEAKTELAKWQVEIESRLA